MFLPEVPTLSVMDLPIFLFILCYCEKFTAIVRIDLLVMANKKMMQLIPSLKRFDQFFSGGNPSDLDWSWHIFRRSQKGIGVLNDLRGKIWSRVKVSDLFRTGQSLEKLDASSAATYLRSKFYPCIWNIFKFN